MTESKERIQEADKEIPDNQLLIKKIKKLQQKRDRFDEPSPLRKFNRHEIQKLDDEIEKLERRLRV